MSVTTSAAAPSFVPTEPHGHFYGSVRGTHYEVGKMLAILNLVNQNNQQQAPQVSQTALTNHHQPSTHVAQPVSMDMPPTQAVTSSRQFQLEKKPPQPGMSAVFPTPKPSGMGTPS